MFVNIIALNIKMDISVGHCRGSIFILYAHDKYAVGGIAVCRVVDYWGTDITGFGSRLPPAERRILSLRGDSATTINNLLHKSVISSTLYERLSKINNHLDKSKINIYLGSELFVVI